MGNQILVYKEEGIVTQDCSRVFFKTYWVIATQKSLRLECLLTMVPHVNMINIAFEVIFLNGVNKTPSTVSTVDMTPVFF